MVLSRMVLAAVVGSSLLGVVGQSLADDPAAERESPSSVAAAVPDQAELEARFEEMLSGVTLVGSFTDDASPDEPLTEDRYVIEKVTKGKNGYWVFQARIQYEGRDMQFAMPLRVEWAGDTPMITLTDVLVPGFGKFTARVLFYGDRYAGTWQGTEHGGHMFGMIERDASEDAAASVDDAAGE